jgi:hypothetical protein
MTTAVATRLGRPESGTEPEDKARARPWDGLIASREDIRFRTCCPGLLSVEVTIHNTSEERSAPAVAVLQSAPLGAFVPWRPLGLLQIPAIESRGSAVVRHEVRYRPAAALAGADKLPPGRLLTALGLDDAEPERGGGGLPADPLSLLGRGSPHWAGNLNIFFPGRDVERHLAQALRIYPGCLNMAMFVVGDRGHDSYRLRLAGDGAEWAARVFDLGSSDFLAALNGNDTGIEPGNWVCPVTGIFMLMIEPPMDATTGAVNVHVEQLSTRREAGVEFSLEAGATVPGCYVV